METTLISRDSRIFLLKYSLKSFKHFLYARYCIKKFFFYVYCLIRSSEQLCKLVLLLAIRKLRSIKIKINLSKAKSP